MFCTAPISLLTICTDTSAVSSPTASRNCVGSRSPFASTVSFVTYKPSRSRARRGSITEECSIALVTAPTSPRSKRSGRNTPCSARLFASVPLPTNTISSAWAPIARATFARAASSSFFAATASLWSALGLPKSRNSRASSFCAVRESGIAAAASA